MATSQRLLSPRRRPVWWSIAHMGSSIERSWSIKRLDRKNKYLRLFWSIVLNDHYGSRRSIVTIYSPYANHVIDHQIMNWSITNHEMIDHVSKFEMIDRDRDPRFCSMKWSSDRSPITNQNQYDRCDRSRSITIGSRFDRSFDPGCPSLPVGPPTQHLTKGFTLPGDP